MKSKKAIDLIRKYQASAFNYGNIDDHITLYDFKTDKKIYNSISIERHNSFKTRIIYFNYFDGANHYRSIISFEDHEVKIEQLFIRIVNLIKKAQKSNAVINYNSIDNINFSYYKATIEKLWIK